MVRVGEGHYDLAPHTSLKVRAAATAFRQGKIDKIIVCGGSNFGIRYDDREILKKPDFSFESFARTTPNESEANIIKKFLIMLGVPEEKIFGESLSATTQENALFSEIILRRKPMFTGEEDVFVISLLYHLEKGFPIFKEMLKGREVKPLCAENFLALEEVVSYYSTPKGGKQYNVERMREILSSGGSLEEMMVI